MGYHRAGFEVIGVDIEPQPRYPFAFVKMDALEVLRVLLAGDCITDSSGKKWYLSDFDLFHASPPCQGYSRLAAMPNRDMGHYPRLIPGLRKLLLQTKKPYVIENVPDAPLNNPLVLCGTMFRLKTHKHRAFECKPPVWFAPAGCNKARVKPKGSGKRLGQYFGDDAPMVTVAGHLFSTSSGSKAMGIDWMTRAELAEAIPPAFTEWIGRQILMQIQTE